MEDWAPMKATFAACSMGWPVVASLGVVLWSKARARARSSAQSSGLSSRRAA